eukprot:9251735-Pyramimonas_sp.AAC.1
MAVRLQVGVGCSLFFCASRCRKLEQMHCQWRAVSQSQDFLGVEDDAGVVWCIRFSPMSWGNNET